jgi:3-hydroxybutyryl-CoA dehydrogenase
VEVIPGERTAEATTQTIYDVARKLGKQPILVKKEVPGFVMNRLQFAAFREALHLVEAGVASPADVDAAMRCGVGFRYPWLGPLETADLGGLDIFHNVAAYLFQDLSAMTEPSPWLKERLAKGELGIKTGRGFYDYGSVDREKVLEARDIFFIRLGRLVRELQAKVGRGS